MNAVALDADVLAAQAGDREAFTRLVDAYRTVVCSIVTAVLRDLEGSEDVAQEVFIAAWQARGKLRNPASFLPWLRQLTRNQAHFFARTRARRLRRQPLAAPGDALLASAIDPSPDANQRLVDAEQLEFLHHALAELPDDAREVITLYYREGHSARHVGELLGLREDAVKKRLERARTVLRRELLERLGDALERTTPGATFTAAVAAALTVGAPATSAAACTAAIGSTTAMHVLGKLALGFTGMGVGLVGGVGGILLGLRRGSRRARDERERRELRKLAVASGLVIVAACLGIQASAMLHSATSLVAVWLVALPIHGWIYLRWLPRIVARRHDAERAEDPRAELRHRKELARGRAGFWIGVIVGSATVAWAAWALAQGH